MNKEWRAEGEKILPANVFDVEPLNGEWNDYGVAERELAAAALGLQSTLQ